MHCDGSEHDNSWAGARHICIAVFRPRHGIPYVGRVHDPLVCGGPWTRACRGGHGVHVRRSIITTDYGLAQINHRMARPLALVRCRLRDLIGDPLPPASA